MVIITFAVIGVRSYGFQLNSSKIKSFKKRKPRLLAMIISF